MITIDLNSDIGEGLGQWPMGDDEALLGIITSANIACGFHAGDPSIMRRTCEIAARLGVAIGAHVSYPDLAGFGRRFIDIAPTELADVVTYQIGALQAIALAAGSRVSYVKPHGALYNTIVTHEAQAAAVVAGVAACGPLPLMGLANSAVLRHSAQAGLPTVTEGFVDRAYNADGSLVSRLLPGAVLRDVEFVAARAVRMVTNKSVIAIDGSEIDVDFDSLCVHGDT
ncbi:MAG: LamB/YcsF family protein, partial [Actinobacteria bacterium]|nr:LamB/YcsF family protein [Actinomycetota bacterium]